jgi:Flp pilus assembly protein CpaB
MVSALTSCCNISRFFILPSDYIDVFLMVIATTSEYFSTQRKQTGSSNGTKHTFYCVR